MRSDDSLFPLAATAVTGFVLAGLILISPDIASAADAKPADGPKSGSATCTCPETSKQPLFIKPKFAELKSELDGTDEIAALENLQLALNETGDGSTFVWHRSNGRLSGLVQPTASFKDASGKVCRHVVVMLTSGPYSRKAEGIACRLDSGQWLLEG